MYLEAVAEVTPPEDGVNEKIDCYLNLLMTIVETSCKLKGNSLENSKVQEFVTGLLKTEASYLLCRVDFELT